METWAKTVYGLNGFPTIKIYDGENSTTFAGKRNPEKIIEKVREEVKRKEAEESATVPIQHDEINYVDDYDPMTNSSETNKTESGEYDSDDRPVYNGSNKFYKFQRASIIVAITQLVALFKC